MEAEYLVFDNCGERNIIKEIGKHCPRCLASILLHAFFVEAIYLRNSSGLMVSSGEVNTFGIPNLESNEQGYSFYRIVPPVNEVAHEQIVSKGDISADGEELDQIMELSMDISANGDWGSYRSGVAFLQEDRGGFLRD
jgi:hypothetical protein